MSEAIDVAVDSALGLVAAAPEQSSTGVQPFDELLRQQREILNLQIEAVERQAASHRQETEQMLAMVLKLSEEQTRLTVQKLDGIVRLFERMGMIDLKLEVDAPI